MFKQPFMQYLDLIDVLTKDRGYKQPDLTRILNLNPRQYRRRVKSGLTVGEYMAILSHFNVQLFATKTTKEGILHIVLGQ